MEINEHRSLLDLAKIKLEPKNNYFLCEFCGTSIETMSKIFFNTDLAELEVLDLINTLLLYFRIFSLQLDNGNNQNIFANKNVLHLTHNNKNICETTPIELYTIIQTYITTNKLTRQIDNNNTMEV